MVLPAAGARPVADPGASDRRHAVALAALVVAIVWGLMTHGTFAGSGDEPHYLVIAHSVAFDADLDVSNNYRDALLPGGGTLEPGAHARWRDGRLRPVHDIGMPLILAPALRIAYPVAAWAGRTLPPAWLEAARLHPALLLRHQLSLLMAIVTALVARELFALLRRLGATPRGAMAAALLFAVSPPVLSHSFLLFTEIPAALVVLFVFRRLTAESGHTTPMVAVLGALTGLLVLIHVRNVGLTLGLALTAVLATRRGALSRRHLAVFGVSLAAGVLVRVATTYVMWGSAFATPHAAPGSFSGAGVFVREIFVRATGLLFDREYGLLAYAPVYLLAVPGVLLLASHRGHLFKAMCLVLGGYLVPVLLPVTNVHGWTGGWSPAARFLVPVAPLLWLAVHESAARASGGWRGIVAAIAGVQILINAFVWQWPKALWNDGDGVSAFAGAAWLPTWTDASHWPAFAALLGATLGAAYICRRRC
jgi:hypothetical protein